MLQAGPVSGQEGTFADAAVGRVKDAAWLHLGGRLIDDVALKSGAPRAAFARAAYARAASVSAPTAKTPALSDIDLVATGGTLRPGLMPLTFAGNAPRRHRCLADGSVRFAGAATAARVCREPPRRRLCRRACIRMSTAHGQRPLVSL